MISEIKEILKNIKQQRPVKENITIYGNYTTGTKEAVYNDDDKCYHKCEDLKTSENVSTVGSFVDFIKEELKRRGKETGKLATAVIDSEGGRFVADDDFQKGKCVYERSLSEQWVTFATCIGKTYNHEEFLRLLQKLSPSIPAFKELYPIFLDIRVIGRAEVVSKPFYVNGEAETGCKIKFKMQGGEDETVILPESFVIRLPFITINR